MIDGYDDDTSKNCTRQDKCIFYLHTNVEQIRWQSSSSRQDTFPLPEREERADIH